MINIPLGGPGFKPLVPTQVKEYLQNKPKYLSTWKKLTSYYFKESEFCDIINTIRIKSIDMKEKIKNDITILQDKENQKTIIPQETFKLKSLNQQQKTIFFDTLKDVFATEIGPRIKNTDISYTQATQLIGSLANISKTPKEKVQEITETVNEEIHEDLSYMETYEYEFSGILEGLIEQYFTSKHIGNTISEGEKKEYTQQAWSIFLSKHKKDIKQEKMDTKKVNTYLHNKKLI